MPDARWVKSRFQTFDRAADAAGLKPLRAVELKPGEREVRIWIGFSIGAPKSLYRLVVQGERVRGERVLYWNAEPDPDEEPGETFHDLMFYNYEGACADFRTERGMGACRARFAEAPDWDRVYERITEQDLWTLPDPSTLPDDGTIVIDGWSMTVELRTPETYRTYHYNNPWAKESWPEAEKANRIASVMLEAGTVRSPDVRRRYRGLTSGEYRSAFRLCRSDTIWAFRPSTTMEKLARRAGIELPEPGEYGYELVVVGRATPEWLADEWESEYTRELQVRKLISVRPAHRPACQSP